MTVAIGTSNAMPNARKMPSTKLRYELMSGAIVTPPGTTFAKNENINRNTTKYAKDIPIRLTCTTRNSVESSTSPKWKRNPVETSRSGSM